MDDRGVKGSTTADPHPAPDDVAEPTTGLVRFIARDRRTDRARSGIPIAFKRLPDGPERTILTGQDGTVNVRMRAGDYLAHVVVGCSTTQVVRYGEKDAHLGVAAGRSMQVTLETESEYLFRPSGPIEWQPDPPWPSAKTVTFSFHLVEHQDCGAEDAPNTSVSPLKFRATGALQIVSAPARSDGSGKVALRVKCLRAGNGTLVLYDPQNPDDANDLLSFRAPFAPSDWCA